ncbi:MAG TPA: 5'-3' exonuclease H3TH domain-containing protein [Kofleriaceae bacterium]|nr:5'-3' exonuclease H3TH domain-containing protein [Kofleriaceae bacterium]
MRAHVVDGTYELFRSFFGAPAATHDGREVGATRGILRSFAAWLRSGQVTHCGVAFDHVIESFRNELFDGYKTGEGVEPALMSQFELAERAAAALGLVVWPMIEFEADDAIATAAAALGGDPRVEQVVITSPDKDMAQCVRGARVICFDRMRGTTMDEDGVIAKFGVAPASIPDWLALVGDDADGIPGVPKWGARSASTVLARWRRVEDIPADPARWEVSVRGAASLAASLAEHRGVVGLYKKLATLREDAPIPCDLETLAWRGVDGPALDALCDEIGLDRSLVDLPIAR